MPGTEHPIVTIHTAQRESKEVAHNQDLPEQTWKEIEKLCSEIGIVSVPDFTSASLAFKKFDLSSPTTVFAGSVDAFSAYLQEVSAINLDVYTGRLLENDATQQMGRQLNDYFTFLEKKDTLQKQHALLKAKVQAYQLALETIAPPPEQQPSQTLVQPTQSQTFSYFSKLIPEELKDLETGFNNLMTLRLSAAELQLPFITNTGIAYQPLCPLEESLKDLPSIRKLSEKINQESKRIKTSHEKNEFSIQMNTIYSLPDNPEVQAQVAQAWQVVEEGLTNLVQLSEKINNVFKRQLYEYEQTLKNTCLIAGAYRMGDSYEVKQAKIAELHREVFLKFGPQQKIAVVEQPHPLMQEEKQPAIKELKTVVPEVKLYDVVQLSRESEEDAKRFINNPFNEDCGYRVTSKWRYEPMALNMDLMDESTNCIYLSKLNGVNLEENCRIMGSFVKLSLDKGFAGKMYFKIAFGGGPMDKPSNLIMLMKLGMIPAPDQGYLTLNYGLDGWDIHDALTALNDCKTFDELSDIHCKSLVKMITKARKRNRPAEIITITEEAITKEVLFRHKDLLCPLRNKRVIPHDFMHNLLKTLEKYGDSEHFPMPEELIKCPLIMSAEGIARWKTAIEENKPFEPFAFEQLEQVMSAEEAHRLSIVYPKFLSKSERYRQLNGTLNQFFKDVTTDRSTLKKTIIDPSTNPEIEGLIASYAFH